jgi:hypothetical protein
VKEKGKEREDRCINFSFVCREKGVHMGYGSIAGEGCFGHLLMSLGPSSCIVYDFIGSCAQQHSSLIEAALHILGTSCFDARASRNWICH